MLLVLFTVNCLNAAAQKVTYSEPDKKENASTAFEIIGKYGNNCLVYKNASHNHYISVYDKEMKLINNEILDFMPDRIINIDFISSLFCLEYDSVNLVNIFDFISPNFFILLII